METKFSRNVSKKRINGQGMSEYLVIVGLLAVAGIAAMGYFGGAFRDTMGGFAAELSGNDSESYRDSAAESASLGSQNSVTGLGGYEEAATDMETRVGTGGG